MAESGEVVTCGECWGKGWSPEWIEDPDDPNGGYEGGERYCECSAGEALREREAME